MTRTTFRPVAAVGCVLVLGLGLTACGGSSDDDALSKSQYIKAADKICKDANKEGESIGADLGDSPSDAEVSAALKEVVKHFRTEVADLRDLKPADSIKDDVDDLLDSLDSAVTKFEDLGSDVLTADEDPFADVNKKADDFGLKVCGTS